MTRIIDWAASHARMVIAFILLSLTAGWLTYTSLPKEGEPDIEIPALFVSVPFPGISAQDAETLLVKPMETELSDLDGLKTMTATAAEGYAGVALEFEFGWDKSQIIADVRDRMNNAEAKFPDGGDQYSINEINFSEFPIVIVNLTGPLPERTLLRVARGLQDRLETLEPVLRVSIAGDRDEMIEVVIDPLRLEAYNVTAAELLQVVQNNNQLIAAGEVEAPGGTFAVKIPSSFDEIGDIYDLPVKVNGDRVVTLGDLADIRLTFEDRTATARFNGEPTVALQIVKRKGFNLIDTVALVKAEVAAAEVDWPEDLRRAIDVGTSNDQSRQVASMVTQLEGSVLTAIALVMIVVLASLGIRSALLVGFAIPTSFLLCFILLGVMNITISNIVMFGLILAVGMLVDGAIVVVEYADRRITEGSGPMAAFTEAAKRMFWPIVSSTATTLCAFLPMLFWPGIAGEFMGMLPVTLIFVLSASLVVALIYLPVMGGVAGRISRIFDRTANVLRARLPWLLRAALVVPSAYLVFLGAMQSLNAAYLLPASAPSLAANALGAVLLLGGAFLTAITLGSVRIARRAGSIRSGHRRTPFGHFTKAIAGNPVMPLVSIGAVIFFVVSVFGYYAANNNGVEFFVESEPEQAIVYIRARGNLSLAEKDDLLSQAEAVVLTTPGIQSGFAFAGEGGLNANTIGSEGPLDAIGQIQIELIPWEDRPAYAASHSDEITLEQLDGDVVMASLEQRLSAIPGIRFETLNLSMGPADAKPVHLRLTGDDRETLLTATEIVEDKFAATPGLVDVEDSRPLPGIDWQIDVDVEKAGRFGADVATVGGMVQLVTRGLFLDTMRVDSSDEEIDIRVRLPEEDRILSTLDSLKVRTPDGLVPLSNFIERKPVASLGQIDRVDQKRYFDVKAGVSPGLRKLVTPDGTVAGYARPAEPGQQALAMLTVAGAPVALVEVADGFTVAGIEAAADDLSSQPVNANERIAHLTEWLESAEPLPPGIGWQWTGEQEDQAESEAFLMTAFAAALGLMFIILLAQFNSFYNSALVLTAVVLSVSGSLVGMLVMGQPFSIIMTGTGIVALAGIVVNNNIVLIDTYQDYSRYMPRIEAIVRTAEDRIRPVLLTTITTMAGLAPMMFGLSLDFIAGGYSIDSPTALWWKQLATAVVFGLGIATVLTLIFTPSMLALRVWIEAGAYRGMRRLRALASDDVARDLALNRDARRLKRPEIVWDVEDDPSRPASGPPVLRAAE
ncbi:transporter, AcrB/AcrD/AcrF family [Oceaniovalibus guishaninsula JLT2003]|uniref:Transporter, AcrB/AcrD/AcrF family n=1 Tax=Oceaniovalibus guishaninsula JLT2003 TaxID=1231392 RepID=K2HA84_9RHOB|nr:efflux RND transporter permease subunit [Oceaniovalibus guishaninsula]EKE43547.1 transporter, AcrB/AcrD/AcrF family [Oceaniovalibus guishaninsula JLT2003]